MLTASTHLTPSPLKPRAARDRSCSSSSDAEADVNTQRAIFQTPTANPSAKKFTTPAASATKASPNKRGAKTAFLKVRDDLAQQLIKELDEAVFEGRLPSDLKIVWNGRLNTTAGRASWKRNKETGGHDAEIELSVKVVDCEDKLKCTLSHEMCHIAAWAIDKEMKPAHGPAFKAWYSLMFRLVLSLADRACYRGRKIMKARKDITVTTKHSYDIGEPKAVFPLVSLTTVSLRQRTIFNGSAQTLRAQKSTEGILRALTRPNTLAACAVAVSHD